MLERVGLRYGQIWRTAAGLLAAIGVIASLVFVSPASNLVAFLISAITVGAVYFSFGLARELPPAELIRAAPRWAGLGGLLVLAACGYGAAVGAETLVLLALLIATSPPIIVRIWPMPKPAREPEPDRHPDVESIDEGTIVQLDVVRPTLRDLTDEELCLAWRRSFKQLQSSTGRELRLGVADVRRAYLDELERRQPEAFAAWLASGPRAAGDPARFFTHRAEH
ncbi:hypothetical protein E0H75_31755 [Kribbella capetownensis]|uniref:Uncharacterized protein n=1 Tax=Kribbella capetownensis TaxID=1572659 RepID=A0A4R0JF78_9ACTN|nr:hypothetical protein [Kribbella capetownensis]TCC45089.1 hypothetical protein E0H75_31755 [Kribbella capetownensis]